MALPMLHAQLRAVEAAARGEPFDALAMRAAAETLRQVDEVLRVGGAIPAGPHKTEICTSIDGAIDRTVPVDIPLGPVPLPLIDRAAQGLAV